MNKNQETGITDVENNNNGQLNNLIIKRIVIFMFMFALSGTIAWFGSVYYRNQADLMIRNVVMILAGTGIVIFSYLLSEANGLFVYQNTEHYGRFALAYLVSLLVAVFFPLLPAAGWPFLVVFVLLGVFSNGITGLTAGSLCLLLAVNFAGCDYAVFWLYFISGMAGILVFATLDEEFKVGIPVLISLMVLGLSLTANVILFSKEKLSMDQFRVPGINLLICCILLLAGWKMISSTVIHRYRDRYMEINDPECPLLVQLREFSQDEYYRAIHTAYLADKVARSLGIDDAAVKTCSYYNRIGKLEGENTWENVSAICDKYHFPPKTKQILQEYLDPDVKMVSKEAIVVLFADCIVSSILYLFSRSPKAELNYEQLIDTVFKKEFESEELWENEISLAQLNGMKKIFIQEKPYYDFLR